MKKLTLILLAGLTVGSSSFAAESQTASEKKHEGRTWKRVAKWSGLASIPLFVATGITRVNAGILAEDWINSLHLQLTPVEKAKAIKELLSWGHSDEIPGHIRIDQAFRRANRSKFIATSAFITAAAICLGALLYGGAKKLLSKKTTEESKKQPATA